jgi:hypothetical protein
MKRVRKGLGITGLGAILLLVACNNQAAPQPPAQTQSINQAGTMGLNEPNVIPSVDRDKKLTTNSNGTTYSGMGTSLYSNIGSSNLHGGGPSTSLEARLNAAGINGIQVLVVNDLIIIAPSTAKSQSINQMDPMQSHLLSNYAGSSSRGPATPRGTAGTLGTSGRDSLLEQARTEIVRLYGTDTQVWSVTSDKGVDALEQVKKRMGNFKLRDEKTGDEMAEVLREARRRP